MAISVEDLFEPLGPLEEEFFPEAGDESQGEDPLSDELDDRIQSYIDQSVAKVAAYAGAGVMDTDAAVKAWSLYLAFHALYLQAVNRPASASLDGLGAAGYAKDQREAFQAQALHWHGVYYEYAPEVPATETGTAERSHAVRNRFTW